MCWSAEVSLNTWLLVVFAAVISLYNNYFSIWKALLLLSFGGIQLVEYFLWTYLKNPSLNTLFSKLGYGLITAQPLFSILNLSGTSYLAPFLLLYGIFGILSIYISKDLKFETIVASNGHLLWKWLPKNILYQILYGILLLSPLYLIKFNLALYASIFTFFVSYITYSKYETWGSMWCYLASLFSVWILVESILFKHSN